jgi:hypothetical protein
LRNGSVEQVGALVGLQQRSDDRGLQSISGEPVGGAGACAEALTGVAGVVAVAPGSAVGGIAEVALVAAPTTDQPGEVVVGGVRGMAGVVVAAFDQQALDLVEDLAVDQRLVGSGVPGATEEDLADVDAVAEDRQHRDVAPAAALAGAMALVVEPVGDGAGAQAFVAVQVEDHPDDWAVFVGGQEAGLLAVRADLEGVAERWRADGPAALGGFAFHAADYPVDDDCPLELGEDGQDLHDHATHRSVGVEVLGRGDQRDPGVVEGVDDVQQPADGAGEPIQPVDQQHVVQAGSCVAQRALEPVTVQGWRRWRRRRTRRPAASRLGLR